MNRSTIAGQFKCSIRPIYTRTAFPLQSESVSSIRSRMHDVVCDRPVVVVRWDAVHVQRILLDMIGIGESILGARLTAAFAQ